MILGGSIIRYSVENVIKNPFKFLISIDWFIFCQSREYNQLSCYRKATKTKHDGVNKSKIPSENCNVQKYQILILFRAIY